MRFGSQKDRSTGQEDGTVTAYRASVLRTSMVSGLCEPPPGREVGELAARPLGFILFL
jgi:hypothetical protein